MTCPILCNQFEVQQSQNPSPSGPKAAFLLQGHGPSVSHSFSRSPRHALCREPIWVMGNVSEETGRTWTSWKPHLNNLVKKMTDSSSAMESKCDKENTGDVRECDSGREASWGGDLRRHESRLQLKGLTVGTERSRKREHRAQRPLWTRPL